MKLNVFRIKMNELQERVNESIDNNELSLMDVVAELECWKFALIIATLKNNGEI